ncbi:MAG TPA: substrate-binding domain-containing protein [Nocardioides sp.]|nr:substrate-binding domain-containing protein [Nocardioides sp.]
MKVHRKAAALVASAVIALAASACGAAGASSGGSGPGLTPQVEKEANAVFDAHGSFGTPPTTSPHPKPGENIWFITASAQYTDFSVPGQIEDAAKKMGWHLTVFDGQFNPDTMVNGLRQAIADKADGVIVYGIDCPIAKAGFQDVAKAGIPIVAFQSFDCNQKVDANGAIKPTGEPGLFDAVVTYNNPDDPAKPLAFPEYYGNLVSRYQALGIIGATHGDAKIIKLKQTDAPTFLALDHGFDATLAQDCPGCKVVDTVEFTGNDFGSALQDKVAQALTQHPEANAVYGIYDAATLNVAPAVMASGRKNSLFVMGGEGTTPVVDLVKAGRGVNAGMVYPIAWEAWASLDAMNRLLAGQKPDGPGFPSGMGLSLYDAKRNLPDNSAYYIGPVDYPSAYLKAWGINAG